MQRTAKAITAAFALLLVLASPAAAAVEIVAPASAESGQPVPFAATAPRGAEEVAFYVDGRQRFVDRTPGWRFGRSGRISLGVGRHVLKVRAKQGNRVTTTATTTQVTPPAATDGPAPSVPRPSRQSPVAPTVPASPSSPEPPPADADPVPAQPGLLDAGFENGLVGWNIAGVGDVVPTVVSDLVRSGTRSARVALTGRQGRSELGLGGVGNRNADGIVFEEGDEYWYGFSFNIRQMVYGGPGAHNLLMQFKSYGEGSPNFGLQLWDYEGDGVSGGKGLWSHSGAMGGDRFLSSVSERDWHDVAIHFRASSVDDGFYEIYLDGKLIDARQNVSMIVPGQGQAYIKTGLYRNPDTLPGTSELRLDAAKLGASFAAVSP